MVISENKKENSPLNNTYCRARTTHQTTIKIKKKRSKEVFNRSRKQDKHQTKIKNEGKIK